MTFSGTTIYYMLELLKVPEVQADKGFATPYPAIHHQAY